MSDGEIIDKAEYTMEIILKAKHETTALLKEESNVGRDTYKYRSLQRKLQSLVYLENLVLEELREMLH